MSFYITTPLYYVNSDPHLGHAYTTVLADIIRRYHRLHGEETFFLTGVDEHGQKVLDAARKLGQDPQEHCDEMAVRFERLWQDLDVEYDHFFRTTSPEHVRVVQEVLQRLWDEGEIYLDDYEGWYCVSDERYFTEKDLVENRCPLCGKEVERFAERNYFFRMGKHRDWLRTYIEELPDFFLPASRRNEVLGFLKNELGDPCISRSRKRMAWGIPLPFDADFVTYVWPWVIGFLVISWVVWPWVSYLWIINLKYFIEDERLVIQKGILTKKHVSIPYSAVTDFTLKRSLYERWLEIGTLLVQTAGQSVEASGYEGKLEGLTDFDTLTPC